VRLDDKFRVGGGLLASFEKGTTIVIEQAPVGSGYRGKRPTNSTWTHPVSETPSSEIHCQRLRLQEIRGRRAPANQAAVTLTNCR
jgi:hypothetical protein